MGSEWCYQAEHLEGDPPLLQASDCRLEHGIVLPSSEEK